MQISNTTTNNVYTAQAKAPEHKAITRTNFNVSSDKVNFSGGFTAPRERELTIIRQQLSDNDLLKMSRTFYKDHLTEKINKLQVKISENKRNIARNKLLKGLGLDVEKKSIFDFLKPSTISQKREEAKRLAPIKQELKDYRTEFSKYQKENDIMSLNLSYQVLKTKKYLDDFVYPDFDDKFSNKLINHILKALPDNLKTSYKDSGEFELSGETRDNVADIIHKSSNWNELKGKFVSKFLATPDEKALIREGRDQYLKDMEANNAPSLFDKEDIKMLKNKEYMESAEESFLLDKYKRKDSFKL